MLIEKIKKSTNQIEQDNKKEELESILKGISGEKHRIEKTLAKIKAWIEIRVLLKEYIELEDIKAEEKNRINFINGCIDRIIDNIDNQKYDNSYKNEENIDNEISILDRKLENKWREFYFSERRGTVSILNLLENLYSDSSKVKLMEKNINRFETKWPFKKQELEKMFEDLKESNRIIEELNVNEKIKVFLKKVSDEEASIVDLDEEILSWLKKYSFDKRLKLRFD